MSRDDIGERIEEVLESIRPLPFDAEAIVERAEGRRRRRRLARGATVLGLATIAAVALAVAGRPGGGPLAPPTVKASASVTLPGEIVDAADGGSRLWVLTCSSECGGTGRDGRGTLVEVDSGSGAIVGTAPVADPTALAIGEGSVWTAGSDGVITRFDPGTLEATGSLRLTLPRPVSESGPEASAFLPDHIAAGEGGVWVSTAREYVAEVDPATMRLVRAIPTPYPVDGIVPGGGAVWLASELAGLGKIDPASGLLGSARPIEGSDGRRLSLGYLAYLDGSLWARGAWATPIGSSGGYALSSSGDTYGMARIGPAGGRIEQLTEFDEPVWIQAVGDSRLWFGGHETQDVYALEPGEGELDLAAHLEEPGTIVGAIGRDLWVARPGRILERYEMPPRES